jgi:hypothetical protein
MEAEVAGDGAEDNGIALQQRSGFPAPGARPGHRIKQAPKRPILSVIFFAVKAKNAVPGAEPSARQCTA